MKRKLYVGDVVTLSIETEDGSPSEDTKTGLILLNIDEENQQIEVLYEWDDFQDVSWASMDRIRSVSREYKIINLNENRNTYTNETMIIAELARLEKVFSRTSEGISYSSMFSLRDFDIFIIPEGTYLATNMLNFPEDNIEIDFDSFKNSRVLFDGRPKEVYHFVE